VGIYLAVIGLVVPTTVSAQQFHPTMVEVGTVGPQQPHVTFDPPFPSAPKVVLSIRDQVVGGPYRGCGVEAKNITATGFDYFPACSARRWVVRYQFPSISKQLGLRPFNNKLAGALTASELSSGQCTARPCATTTANNLPRSISRMSRGGDRRRSCC
jgi:hypothetical protein